MEREPGGSWPYKEAVGVLMWLVVWSRLEIANTTRVVARHATDSLCRKALASGTPDNPVSCLVEGPESYV